MKTALDAVLESLTRLHPKRIDLSLGRLHRLLDRLGRPHERLPPVIHVAGTNGKGSVVAHLRAFLEADGKQVHVYTSPHLVSFAERIRLAGQVIRDAHLLTLLERCESANGEQPITFFEVTTAAAMLAFAETPADILLLEVGLGGRLDATNVVNRPLATVITRISYDHRQFLGDRIEQIAAEKAGIAKQDVPLVVAPQAEAGAVKAIVQTAAMAGAALDLNGRDWWHNALDAGGLELSDSRGSTWYPPTALAGRHQLENAATAIRAAQKLAGLTPSSASIQRGLAQVQWPARLMRLRHGPLTDAIGEGGELWLDGGHNDSAGAALAQWLEDRRAAGLKAPVHLVVGMLESKMPEEFLTPLSAHADRLSAVEIPQEKASLSPEILARAAQASGIAQTHEVGFANLTQTLAADPSALVLICGSLYLAGRILKQHR